MAPRLQARPQGEAAPQAVQAPNILGQAIEAGAGIAYNVGSAVAQGNMSDKIDEVLEDDGGKAAAVNAFSNEVDQVILAHEQRAGNASTTRDKIAKIYKSSANNSIFAEDLKTEYGRKLEQAGLGSGKAPSTKVGADGYSAEYSNAIRLRKEVYSAGTKVGIILTTNDKAGNTMFKPTKQVQFEIDAKELKKQKLSDAIDAERLAAIGDKQRGRGTDRIKNRVIMDFGIGSDNFREVEGAVAQLASLGEASPQQKLIGINTLIQNYNKDVDDMLKQRSIDNPESFDYAGARAGIDAAKKSLEKYKKDSFLNGSINAPAIAAAKQKYKESFDGMLSIEELQSLDASFDNVEYINGLLESDPAVVDIMVASKANHTKAMANYLQAKRDGGGPSFNNKGIQGALDNGYTPKYSGTTTKKELTETNRVSTSIASAVKLGETSDEIINLQKEFHDITSVKIIELGDKVGTLTATESMEGLKALASPEYMEYLKSNPARLADTSKALKAINDSSASMMEAIVREIEGSMDTDTNLTPKVISSMFTINRTADGTYYVVANYQALQDLSGKQEVRNKLPMYQAKLGEFVNNFMQASTNINPNFDAETQVQVWNSVLSLGRENDAMANTGDVPWVDKAVQMGGDIGAGLVAVKEEIRKATGVNLTDDVAKIIFDAAISGGKALKPEFATDLVTPNPDSPYQKNLVEPNPDSPYQKGEGTNKEIPDDYNKVKFALDELVALKKGGAVQDVTGVKEEKLRAKLEELEGSFPKFSPAPGGKKTNEVVPTMNNNNNNTTKPTINPEVLDHLQRREGFRSAVYEDSLGKPTVGTGHLLTGADKEKYPVGTEVPQEQLDAWLEEDSIKAFTASEKQASELGLQDNQDFKDALVSVNFQLGTNWKYKFPSAYRALKDGNYDRAIAEVKYSNPKKSDAESTWSKQTPVRVKDFVDAIEQLKI